MVFNSEVIGIFSHFVGSTITSISMILATTYLGVRVIRKLITKCSALVQDSHVIDAAHYRLFRHFIEGFIYFVGISLAIASIPPLKNVAFSFLASSGVLAVIVGFASQQVFSNIIGGLFLGFYKPFVIGDFVKVKDIIGEVEDITLRHTVIKTDENKHIMIPNIIMNSEVIENASWINGRVHKYIDIPISYTANMNRALDIVQEELEKHPNTVDARSDEEKKYEASRVGVQVVKFSRGFIQLRGWVWAKNEDQAAKITHDAYRAIKHRFDEEKISFPTVSMYDQEEQQL